MKVLYNFFKYPSPKVGVFHIDTNKYKLPVGWIQKEETYTIIGEDIDTYVYKILPSNHGEWVGEKVIQHKYLLPIGIHKSRLVKWLSGQLTLNFKS